MNDKLINNEKNLSCYKGIISKICFYYVFSSVKNVIQRIITKQRKCKIQSVCKVTWSKSGQNNKKSMLSLFVFAINVEKVYL